MGFLIAFAVLLAVASAGRFARAATPEHWERSRLSINSLLTPQVIDPVNCYKDLRSFRGCMEILNALAMRGKTPHEVVPERLVRAGYKTGIVWKRLSPELLLTTKVDLGAPLSLRQLNQTVEDRRRLRDVIIARLFEECREERHIDFVGLTEKLVSSTFIPEPLTKTDIGKALNRFYAITLDPHAQLIPAKLLEELMEPPSEKTVGVGLRPQNYAGLPFVLEVEDGSVAKAAGVRRGDFIESIDGQSFNEIEAEGRSLKEALQGIEGSSVRVGLRRLGIRFEVHLRRQKMDARAVRFAVKFMHGHAFGFLQIRDFMDQTLCEQLRGQLEQRRRRQLAGLIVDLRMNGGGRLDLASCVLGALTKSGSIGYLMGTGKEPLREPIQTTGDRLLDLPLAVLLNATSASASEIVAGAIREADAGWIIGERSFGKGSAQQLAPYGGDPELVRLQTESGIYFNDGTTPQLYGLIPDFPAFSEPGLSVDEQYTLREVELFPESEPWKAPALLPRRNEKRKVIRECRQKNRLAENRFFRAPGEDYPALVAAEVLLCDAQ